MLFMPNRGIAYEVRFTGAGELFSRKAVVRFMSVNIEIEAVIVSGYEFFFFFFLG
jgi:hypothetical protein